MKGFCVLSVEKYSTPSKVSIYTSLRLIYKTAHYILISTDAMQDISMRDKTCWLRILTGCDGIGNISIFTQISQRHRWFLILWDKIGRFK